ncbi:MAG: methyltransferase domain-containing protein [Myxococcota bacterium]
MQRQVELLQPDAGGRIADIGCGNGGFITALSGGRPRIAGSRVIGLDLVRDALCQWRSRPGGHERLACQAQLSLTAGAALPIADASLDGAMASLLLSYVEEPELLIQEMARVLRGGARLVISTMRPDADVSSMWRDGVMEAAVSRRDDLESGRLLESGQSFLNDGARLLSLGDKGVFRFWERDELGDLLDHGGFSLVHTEDAFGDPSQAVIALAVRS